MALILTSFKVFLYFCTSVGAIIFVCEYLVYYSFMYHCSWSSKGIGNTQIANGQIGETSWLFNNREEDGYSPRSQGDGNAKGTVGMGKRTSISKVHSNNRAEPDALHAFFIADPHLLGNRHGHWFDKMRREWQMERAFQTAQTLLNPDAVFVLGDLTDEGKWADDEEFEATVKRFKRMFRHPPRVQFEVVVGNHDVGFHNMMNQHKLDRFFDAFSSTGVSVITIKENSFVLVNSMAFHGDSCNICSSAKSVLQRVSERLNCSRFGHHGGLARDAVGKAKCEGHAMLPHTPPILLQHFPLYRPNDAGCTGIDGTPPEEKYVAHGEKREVISQVATNTMLSWIQPRLVLSGHTHHGCYLTHRNRTPEISVPSFSWRNRLNPSIVLATITPTTIAINKCFLPEESLIINLYKASLVVMVICVFGCLFRIGRQRHHRKHVKRL